MKKTIFTLFMLYVSLNCQVIDRITGSPYPASSKPDTLYKLTDGNFSDSKLLTISTLQGILAQNKPRIYRISSQAYTNWLTDLQTNYGITVLDGYDANFTGLITHFKREIKNYILCNLTDNSVNVAISLSGITNSVAVTTENQALFTYLGIPMLADVRGKDEFWFFQNYGQQINKNIFCFQKESMSKFLADYSTFGRMITFYNPSFTTATDNIFGSFNTNAAVFGWGFDEYAIVDKSSVYSVFVHAADLANNLSTLSNFNVETKQNSSVTAPEMQDSVHTVCFLMTDGDNIQWVLNDFSTNSNWFASSNRTKADIGWTMSPALSEIAPTVLKKYYDLAGTKPGGRDYFVAGPSGLGYIFPERYYDLQGYAELTNEFMAKSDLRILNLLGNSDDDKYLAPYLAQNNIDALFYYFYSDYSGGKGKIKWVNNKPVIYGRYNLWTGFESSSTLAQKLNAASRDIHSAAGYSLIPVHVWSKTVTDVINCVKLLNPNVRVAAPDEFAALIKANVPAETTVLSIIPDNGTKELTYIVPGYKGSGYDASHRWADNSAKMIYHFTRQDLLALSGGNENLRIDFTVSNEYVVKLASSLNGPWAEILRWSATSTPVTNGSNKQTLSVDLKKYFTQGWQDIYISFEDGIPADGWGPSLYNISIIQARIVSTVESNNTSIPQKFMLEQNYPNPFNPSTSISFNLEKSCKVKLEVYDLFGRLINTLVDSYQQSGKKTIKWDAHDNAGHDLPSGVYVCRLFAGEKSETRKMMLLR